MTNQEFSKKAIRHGEIAIKPIDSLPGKAKEIYTGEFFIVGHSETGHHHLAEVKEKNQIRVYELDNELYLDVRTEGIVKHQKTGSFVHETKTLYPGIYKIDHKKEYDPFQKKMRSVMD